MFAQRIPPASLRDRGRIALFSPWDLLKTWRREGGWVGGGFSCYNYLIICANYIILLHYNLFFCFFHYIRDDEEMLLCREGLFCKIVLPFLYLLTLP